MLDLLRNLPEQDAQRVLQSIRAGVDIVDIVNHVKAGDLLLQMSVLPETRFRYDFPYKTEMPEDDVANNPYLESFIFEASSLYSAGGYPLQSMQSNGSRIAESSSRGSQDVYLKPFHAAEVIDSRLCDADISSWTTVCNDNVLMRGVLNVWLRCEYQFTAAIQKDLFLEDMIAGRDDFCSSLLVNIILGYACVRSSNYFNNSHI